MIKDKTIYFGYGDIAVGSTFDGYLTLQWFKPPQEVGSTITGKEVIWLSEEIKLKVTSEDLKNIDNINEESNKQLIIGDYVLDFSNYNSTSIKVVKKYMNIAISSMLRYLAC